MRKKKMTTENVTPETSSKGRYKRPNVPTILVEGKPYQVSLLTDDDIDALLKAHPSVSVYFQKK